MNLIADKRIFVDWNATCTRTTNIARALNAKVVHIAFFGHRPTAIAKVARYVASIFATFYRLYRERAEIIISINSPPFVMACVYVFSRFSGALYMLDSHSGPFNDPKWKWFRPLYRRIAKEAILNINTNLEHKQIVEEWGGYSEIISDVPIRHDHEYELVDVPKKSILVVCSYMFDEPIEEILVAAKKMPNVHFFLTGNPKAAKRGLLDGLPANVSLTGFVAYEKYFGLMKSVKAVMVLTERDNTMQRGAYEALSVEVPIITSDREILRESFGDGAVYVDNTAADIVRAVMEILEQQDIYRKSISRQRAIRQTRFDCVRATIENVLASGRQHQKGSVA